MPRHLPMLAGLALALSSLLVMPAAAQGWARGGGGGARVVQQPPPLANPPAADAWPRLEPGAVVCRSQEALSRRAAAMADRAAGGEAPVMPRDCSGIRSRTAIEIIRRAGPGRTEVRLTNPAGGTGWTDAWLPERRPR